jgi:hypothetical protein
MYYTGNTVSINSHAEGCGLDIKAYCSECGIYVGGRTVEKELLAITKSAHRCCCGGPKVRVIVGKALLSQFRVEYLEKENSRLRGLLDRLIGGTASTPPICEDPAQVSSLSDTDSVSEETYIPPKAKTVENVKTLNKVFTLNKAERTARNKELPMDEHLYIKSLSTTMKGLRKIGIATREDLPKDFDTPTEEPVHQILSDVLESIEGMFGRIELGLYTVYSEVRDERLTIATLIPRKKYCAMVSDHDTRFLGILSSHEADKCTLGEIGKSVVSSVESRVIDSLTSFSSKKGYLDEDERKDVICILNSRIKLSRTPTLYSHNQYLKTLSTYSLALRPVEEWFADIYGSQHFPQIIHINTKDADATFYTLSWIDGDRRLWKRDLRLENTGVAMSDYLVSYLVGVFRCMYQSVYHHNEYYIENLLDMEEHKDMATIIRNLFVVANTHSLSEILCSVVRSREYIPSKSDAFDYLKDSEQSKEQYYSSKTDKVDLELLGIFDDYKNSYEQELKDFCYTNYYT